MKLKKVIINGEVYYKEDIDGNYNCEEDETIKNDEPEVVDVDDDTTFKEKVKKYSNKVKCKMEKLGAKINDECKDIAKQINDAMSKFNQKAEKVENEDELEEIYDECLDDIDDIEDQINENEEENILQDSNYRWLNTKFISVEILFPFP